MLSVNMHEAKSKLSALVAAVESGREGEVILTRDGKPAARIVPFVERKGIVFGVAKGEFEMPSDESWAEMDKEIERMFEVSYENKELPDAAE